MTYGNILRLALITYSTVLLGVIILLAFGVDLVRVYMNLILGVYVALFLLLVQPVRFAIRAIRRRRKTSEEPKRPRVTPPDTAHTSRPLPPAWYRRIGVGTLAGAAVILCVVGYVPATFVDVQKIDDFCADVKPGLEVSKLPGLIEKHNVDLWPGYDPIGKKTGLDDEWMTRVAAVTSIGEHRCSVYHNQRFVTRVEPFSG